MQTRGAVWQLRPDAAIAPARWSMAGRPNTLCNAPALRCRPGVDSLDLVMVQLLVLTLHKVQSTSPHSLPPCPGPRPRSSHTVVTHLF